jgi:hypothetical protein
MTFDNKGFPIIISNRFGLVVWSEERIHNKEPKDSSAV